MLNGQLFHRVLGGLAEGEAEMGAVVKEIYRDGQSVLAVGGA